MMHNRGIAPTRGTSRPLRTPLPPPQRTEEEAKLTYKPSQRPWAILLWNLSEPSNQTPFAQYGRSVQIYSAQQIPVSPTQYPGQTTEWLRTDHDTVYRFQKRVKLRRMHIVETSVSVPHMKLLPYRPTAPTPLSAIRCPQHRYHMDPETVVYTKEAMTITFQNVPLEVKMYTGLTLSKAASRHQRPGDKISNTNPENMLYIAQVYVETQEWHWMPCAKGVTVNSLAQPTAEQIAALNRKTLSKPKVVSAEMLPLHMRQLIDVTQIEDIHE